MFISPPHSLTLKQKTGIFWTVLVFVSMALFFLFTKSSYQKIDAVMIWALSCIGILYLSRTNDSPLNDTDAKKVVAIGFVVIVFSFINIPIGFGNPPYSTGDFSIFLVGIGLVIIGLLRIRTYILPISLPLVAVVGFQIYDHFLRNEDWITAPLIPPVVMITYGLLTFAGVSAQTYGNVIWFNSVQGVPVYISIISDCTGIWSLGTFTIASLIVVTSFPQVKSRRGLFLILIGYIGTYIANLTRVFIIAMSGYYFGPSGLIEQVHVHIGWIVFTLWMVIFWYYFFTRFLGFAILPAHKEKSA